MDYRVDVRKLELFNEMARQGANTVSDHLNQLSGLDTAIEVSKINLLDMADVKTHLGDDEQVGIYVRLQEPPYGYVLFMLDPAGASASPGGWSATWATRARRLTDSSPTWSGRPCRRSGTS
jgi:chemotaxis protein CheC